MDVPVFPQFTWLPGLNFRNAYTYDGASNRTSLTAPEGGITTYGYDTLNRLNGLANSWAGSFGFGYDALSRRTSLTRPNGVNTGYSYDSLSRLLSVVHQAGVNTLDGASYAYDAAGNRTAKTNYLNGVTSNYGYDPLYELTQVTQGGSTTESYSYDAVGNRLSSSGVPTYNYNSSNELTSNSAGSYTYDANGNTLTDASGKSYTWDFENRLTQAVVSGANGGTTTFKYDPFGRRIQRSGPFGITNFLYDNDNLIEELDQSGSVLSRYAQNARYPVGPAIDEPLSMLRSGTTNYYESAGLSSITSLSNSSGTVVASYVYDSFGNLTASSGSITNPFRFTGREFDSETGIYEYRHRYYDPSNGRFISEDPLHFGGGDLDVYVYVHSEPTSYNDPSGTTKYWGNWCGPDWTGGLVEEYTPLHAGIYKKPQDAEDTVCMHHDICYFNCRFNHACDSGARTNCLKHCDQIFLAEMPMTAVGDYLSTGIFWHSLNPGNGGSDAHCGCRWAMYPTSLPGLDISILGRFGSR